MVVLYPTDKIRKIESIFLAGSIENNLAENWQESIIDMLKNENITIYNPRRKEWNPLWEQSEDNPQFKQQVVWELNCLDKSDLIVLYFDPNTKSPISLLELGLYHNKQIILCCPVGFWRKGNVDIVCRRYNNIIKVETLKEVAEEVKNYIKLGSY